MAKQFVNHDITNIVTPVRVDRLKSILQEVGYDEKKSQFLVQGFSQGFDLGYRGPQNHRDTSDNIPLKLGMPTDLWNKVMDEVKLGRYAGPFETPPYEYFMQSPIGLVPKSGFRKTSGG